MIQELFKFIDCFGIQFSFYFEGKRKHSTSIGGILTTITLLLCIVSFIVSEFDNFKRKKPILYTYELPYSSSFNLESEKILIPFRIINLDQNSINKNLVINMFYNNKPLPLKLCNETDFEMQFNYYYLNESLNEFYCIEISEDQINSTVISSFNNSIKLEIHSNEKIIYNNINGYGIEIYLPTLKLLPKSYKYPFYILFTHYIYFFNKFSYKVDNIFIQKNIFIEDNGLIFKNNKKYSVLSCSNTNSDFYYKDNNTTILYSSNIKLESIIKYNEKSFKKLLTMFSNSFPLFYIIFWIFQHISHVIKLSEEKRKIFESMFENIVEKDDKFALFAKKIEENNAKQKVDENKSESKNNFFDSHKNNNLSINKKNEDGTHNLSSIHINRNFPHSSKDDFRIFLNDKVTPNCVNWKNSEKIVPSFVLPKAHRLLNLNPIKKSIKKQEKKLLFPYKFYLLSIFCKNITKISIENLNHIKCLNKNLKKFFNLNNYIGHFLDLNSYIILQREFNILKEKLFNKKHFSLLENYTKININDCLEIRRLMECVDAKKETHIF